MGSPGPNLPNIHCESKHFYICTARIGHKMCQCFVAYMYLISSHKACSTVSHAGLGKGNQTLHNTANSSHFNCFITSIGRVDSSSQCCVCSKYPTCGHHPESWSQNRQTTAGESRHVFLAM